MLICEAVEPDGKTCRACEQYKRLDEYADHKSGKYGKHARCKACHNDWGKAHRIANLDRIREADRKAKLKALCGISHEQQQEAWDAQGGLCAICAAPLSRGKGGAATDHDHGTKQFRAMLCRGCNTGIGQLQDDPALMRKAAAYVEAHRARSA